MEAKQHEDTKRFSKLILKQISETLQAISQLVNGPNSLNQMAAVSGSLLEVVSKFLQSLDLSVLKLQKQKDVKPIMYLASS